MVEKLIKVGHLKQYVHTTGGQRETVQELAIQALAFLAVLRVVINYIHGGFVDDRDNSKRQRRRLLRVASVKERVHSV